MINIDQALTWVTWAVFSGWALGALCGAALVFALVSGSGLPRLERNVGATWKSRRELLRAADKLGGEP